MAVETTSRIEGPTTATVHQVLGWVMRNNPASGTCDEAGSGGRVVEYLWETDRLSKKLGWDFAVVAAHASATTDAFTSPSWKEVMNTIPTGNAAGVASEAVKFTSPQQAAAAHVAYLATLVSGGDGVALAEASEPLIGFNDLRAAGYLDLLPAGSSRAAASGEPVQVLEDLTVESNQRSTLTRHLAGIRAASVVQDEIDVPVEAPPLPDIQWVGTDNFHPRPGGMQPTAICYHTTWDMSLQNVINHFRSPGSQASSTFVIDRDGTPYQMVSSRHAPWTNGDYRDVNTGAWNNPTTLIPWLTRAIEACERREHNLNEFFITYEFISTPDIPPTDVQYETAIQLSRYFCHPAVYGISPHRGHHLRHADINEVSRSFDPGKLFDLRRIILAIGGNPTDFNG